MLSSRLIALAILFASVCAPALAGDTLAIAPPADGEAPSAPGETAAPETAWPERVDVADLRFEAADRDGAPGRVRLTVDNAAYAAELARWKRDETAIPALILRSSASGKPVRYDLSDCKVVSVRSARGGGGHETREHVAFACRTMTQSVEDAAEKTPAQK